MSQGHISDSVHDCHGCIRLTLSRRSSSLHGPLCGQVIVKLQAAVLIVTVRLTHLHHNNTPSCLHAACGNRPASQFLNHAERPLTNAGHLNAILFAELHFQAVRVLWISTCGGFLISAKSGDPSQRALCHPFVCQNYVLSPRWCGWKKELVLKSLLCGAFKGTPTSKVSGKMAQRNIEKKKKTLFLSLNLKTHVRAVSQHFPVVSCIDNIIVNSCYMNRKGQM